MFKVLTLLKLMFSDDIGGRLKGLASTKLKVETANRQSSNRVRAYRTHPCISELPYHSNKPPGRQPYTPKANNRRVAQGAAGQPINTTGQLPDNTTECKAGL